MNRCFLTIVFILITIISYGQESGVCNIRSFQELEKVKINLVEFNNVDTIINNTSYKIVYVCSNGNKIWGNIKNNKKNGNWLFCKDYCYSYGKYKNDKLVGKWQFEHMTIKYSRGKRKSVLIPF